MSSIKANLVESPTQAKPSFANQKYVYLLLSLALISCLSLLCAAVLGSVTISQSELFQAVPHWLHSFFSSNATQLNDADSIAQSLLDLRLNRALTAWVTGAALSLAGVLMQALLRNPLADPYVLGISGGSAVGALLALLLGCTTALIDISAFAGAVVISLLLLSFARKDWKSPSAAPLLLLTGVILSAGCSAIVSLILAIAPDSSLRGMVFWLIGDLSAAPLRATPWVIFVVSLAYCLSQARPMNILAMFSDNASTLGIAVGSLRLGLFTCAALLTASAVTTAGSIGFLGLIVPHACRFAWGPDHRVLIPAAALAGGSFLVLADTLARTVLAPLQLPVGVITALIGVPIFLLQLYQVRQHQLR